MFFGEWHAAMFSMAKIHITTVQHPMQFNFDSSASAEFRR